jgi:hypothetical protein
MEEPPPSPPGLLTGTGFLLTRPLFPIVPQLPAVAPLIPVSCLASAAAPALSPPSDSIGLTGDEGEVVMNCPSSSESLGDTGVRLNPMAETPEVARGRSSLGVFGEVGVGAWRVRGEEKVGIGEDDMGEEVPTIS